MSEAEFIKYVRSFYGTKGIYAEFFATNPPGPSDYRAAFRTLLSLRAQQGVPFDGDSYDREVMRDLLFVRMGILKANETEYRVEG
jgi:hypothetical protein